MSFRRSNQSILKEISPGYPLEGLMLKLKLQYFGHLMQRVDTLEKTVMLGGIGAGGEGDDRGWDGWMASLTRWTWIWVNSRSWWWTGKPGVLQFVGSQRVGHDWATELNWKLKPLVHQRISPGERKDNQENSRKYSKLIHLIRDYYKKFTGSCNSMSKQFNLKMGKELESWYKTWCSISLVTRRIQIKTTKRYLCTPARKVNF